MSRLNKQTARERRISVDSLYLKLREMWTEGFGFGAITDPQHVPKMRAAMRRLVENDAYWLGVTELCKQTEKVRQLKDALK